MFKRIRNKHLRYFLSGLIILICFFVGWFLLSRVLSPLKAIQVKQSVFTKQSKKTFSGGLRIGTYNIAHARGSTQSNWQMNNKGTLVERLKQIAQLLEAEELDIAVLNEVDFCSVRTCNVNQAEYLAIEAGFPCWVEQRNVDVALPLISHRYGNAILSRYPILEAQLLAFPGYSIWETVLLGKKHGLLCIIELADTLTVRLLAVHLEHRSASIRVRSAKMIEEVREASSLPLVVAGDFNSTPITFPYADLDAHGQTAVSWLLNTGAYQTAPLRNPSQDDLTFPSVKPISVIDWIMVPVTWKVLSKRVIDWDLSDHRAVVMEVQVHDRG